MNSIFSGLSLANITSIREDCFQQGECRNSEHVSGHFATDEYDCLQLCNEEPSCQWFTFSPQLTFCELLHDCNILDSIICKDCLSGVRDCSPQDPQCWIQGECKGTVDFFQETETKEECLKLCQSTLGCRWFTFWEPASPCFLFKNCSTIDESCQACISGERRCDTDLPTTTTTTDASTTTERPKGKFIFTMHIFITTLKIF